jgi:hypothetical protein
MDSSTVYRLAADAVLLCHVLFVAFVVIGLLLIFVGKFCAWPWIRDPWFRILHLAAIALVVVPSWFGIICPLTTVEMYFRSRAAGAVYSGSFIAHWLESLLYYQLPSWVFVAAYTVFGVITLASWIWIRPRPFSN